MATTNVEATDNEVDMLAEMIHQTHREMSDHRASHWSDLSPSIRWKYRRIARWLMDRPPALLVNRIKSM